ncbi:peptidoglycan DD-metalloendopeptidase family protein [Patescibacteria group bacterium]|nr:peptidoglycan DD-metalloendopeptidase family protein [Patescibacteria group bacterium]
MVKKLILILFILFLLPMNIWAESIDNLKEQIQQKELEIIKLEQEAEKYKAELKNTQGEKNTLNNQINTIQSRINKLKNDIYLTNSRIDGASLKIEELSLNIYEKQNEIDKKKDSIAQMIQALYEADQESLMEIVLMKSSFSEFLNQVHYLELMQKRVQNDLTALQSLKAEMQTEKSRQEFQRNELYSLNNQLYSQKKIVDNEKKEKDYLLHQTKGEEKQYQSLLNDVLVKQQEIQQEVYELEDKLQSTINPDSLPEERSGVLSWPMGGILTQGYGITPYSKRLYVNGFHNGIDIASSYGEPIKSARDGIVLAIGSCGRYAYGNWIAIKHDNGLTTLYAHLSGYASLKVGNSVKRGQTIGYEGNTGYSTGAHLHFGVYVTETFKVESRWYGQLPIGAHLNPLKYL